MYFYENIQSLPLGYQKLLLMLPLMSLYMLASHRCGRPDTCGTGFSWCHCGHHRWFHDAVPLGREKPGRESKPIARLNKDSTWAMTLYLSICSGDMDGCQPPQLSKAEQLELCGSSLRLIPPPPSHQVVFSLGRNSKAIMSCPSLAQLEPRMCLHQTVLQKGKDRTLPPQPALWIPFLLQGACAQIFLPTE